MTRTTTAGTWKPGGWCPYCRDDRRPILGDTEPERRQRLIRLRGALVAAGVGEVEGNRRANRDYGVIGIELLTATEADELIAALGGAMSAVANIGKVSGEVAEAFAFLMSPSAILHEVREYETAIAAGDTSPQTAQLLADWRAIQRTQARLVGGTPQQTTLGLAVGR